MVVNKIGHVATHLQAYYNMYAQGRSCEIDMNMCRSDPCLNGGTCSNSPNTFECTCAPGFNGSTCDGIVPGAKADLEQKGL